MKTKEKRIPFKTLETAMFPITKKEVYVDIGDSKELEKNYFAIIREDTKEVISIMKNTYTPISNGRVINSVLSQLDGLKYELVKNTSYLSNSRMILHLTFPEIKFTIGNNDEYSLSLYIMNSYDGSLSLKYLIGALRWVCTNGNVFGETFSKIYKKHTKQLIMNDVYVYEIISAAKEKLPELEYKLNKLAEERYNREYAEKLKEFLGSRLMYKLNLMDNNQQYIIPDVTLYALYNHLTYQLTHYDKDHKRINEKLLNVAQFFKL